MKLSAVLQILFVCFAAALTIFFRQTPEFATLSITFVSIFLEALPFMLLGSLASGIIEVFVSQERIAALFPKSKSYTIFLAAGMGLVLPICECAIVPIIRRLLHKGFPLGASIAFLIGAPIVNPLVAVSTAVAYGYDGSIVFERLAFGYLLAVGIGLLVNRYSDSKNVIAVHLPFYSDISICGCGHNHCSYQLDSFLGRLIQAIRHAAEDFSDVVRFLVFGAFISGILQTYVSRGIFTALSDSVVLSVSAMMFLAIILNLCSEADAFVAVSFRSAGVPLTAQMAFMVLGPMLDIKLMLMYLSVFKKRFIISLSCTTFLLVFLCMIFRGFFTQ
ncbi:MAG: permease [Desulfamplus sp.]|nr:permease [Desulfamplus sp.]